MILSREDVRSELICLLDWGIVRCQRWDSGIQLLDLLMRWGIGRDSKWEKNGVHAKKLLMWSQTKVWQRFIVLLINMSLHNAFQG